ncbi:MAG TPA: NADH:flavin oxidoreductase/NADH oxidase, partial [Dehalococcoidia bacterium]|nr:NADH:flavin oxidoreductase/NADH oxidase [Dehalococcoidia bacterium]
MDAPSERSDQTGEITISKLFSPLKIRGETLPNRVAYSPMCEYTCDTDGVATDFHKVHLGSKALGGTGLVMAEATAVRPDGRISPSCQGLWNDAQVDALRPITAFISSQGSVPAVQIAHAGRKASHSQPWNGSHYITEDEGGWKVVAPSAIPYDENTGIPHELSKQEIADITQAFAEGAARAVDAGYRVIELHFAHGYLACEFMSPLSNQRTDEYGGSLENRCRFALETIAAVRASIPESVPLLARISATEYVEGGWDLEQSIQISKWMKDAGVDLIDTSSGGNSPAQVLKPVPNYQVSFSAEIREQVGIMTGAVGLITEAEQAESILVEGQADTIFIGRELMRNPFWPL